MKPQVDFHVLPDADLQSRLRHACRLVDTAYRQALTVCVCLNSPAEVEEFSELLWTFDAQSFIPHDLISEGSAITAGPPPATPVWVGQVASVAADLLVNLSETLPPEYVHFKRVAEIIDADPIRREAGRRRFVGYRDAGITPETHRVNA